MALDNPKNKGELLESVGYSKNVAEAKPTEIIEQKGVKDSLRELGLTEELITSSLVEDIRLKPQNRVQEIKLGAEILGMKIDKDLPSEKLGNIYNFFFSKEIQEDVKELENKIKQKLVEKHVQEN